MAETSQVGKAGVVESLPCHTEGGALFTPRPWEGCRQLADDLSSLSAARGARRVIPGSQEHSGLSKSKLKITHDHEQR